MVAIFCLNPKLVVSKLGLKEGCNTNTAKTVTIPGLSESH